VFQAVSGFESADHQREVVRIQPAQVTVELGGHHRGRELWIPKVHHSRCEETNRCRPGHEWSRETERQTTSDQSGSGDDASGTEHRS
jgi:hypothetical protein